jgi:hypothetical protein
VATSVVDTCGIFAVGVNNTIGQLAVSLVVHLELQYRKLSKKFEKRFSSFNRTPQPE